MSSKESVLKVLQNLKSPEAASPRAKAIAKWKKAVEDLYKLIGKWLKDANANGLLTVHFTTSHFSGDLGSYELNDMVLKTPDATEIRIMPKTPQAFGGKGRVNFVCAPKERMLIRSDDESWGFAEPDPVRGYRLRPLTEESFWDIVADLLSVRAV